MKQIDITFAELISTAMEGMGIGCVRLSENLALKGKDVKFKAISAYARGTQIPYYERARAILDELGIDMSENTLSELLAYSRNKAKEDARYFYGESSEIRKKITIRIKPSALVEGLSAYEAERLLEQRVEMVAGDKTKFSDYIKKLIVKDLNEYILNEDEDTKERTDLENE